MPVPEPRPGFVDEALARAAAADKLVAERRSVGAFGAWQMWFGAALGAVVAAVATFLIMRPQLPHVPETGITLAINESRNVEVLIDSERTLDDATIRVVTTGAVELAGFDDKHVVTWQIRLERGRNVLSLPVFAHGPGPAQLVAEIEHQGRTRKIAVNLIVKQSVKNEVA